MGRQARQFSETGMYHIVFRGVNHCHLFEEENDYIKFLDVLKRVKAELDFEIYSYCLMSNHVHLFIYEKNMGDIVKAMKRLLTPYVGWFNRKYKRSGTLVANRYKSECIEDEKYFYSLIRYIHLNPVKAGIVSDINEYEWSSFKEYKENKRKTTNIDFMLNAISKNRKVAIKNFLEFHQKFDDEEFIPTYGKKKSEEQIRREIIHYLNGKEPNYIITLDRATRNEILIGLKNRGLSIRQIERATGISRGVIQRCCQNRTVPN